MEVAILFKWGHDADDALVYDDGSYKYRRNKLFPSDDDATAVANARRLAQAAGGSLTAVTLGNGDASWAVARGATRCISASGFMPGLDEAQTAKALSRAVQEAGGFDVVAVADARDASGVAATLAAELGMPAVLGVNSLEACADDSSAITVTRRLGKRLETLRVGTPVVLGISALEAETEIPTVRQMLAAKKVPVDTVEVDCAAEGMRVVGRRRPETQRARMFEGEPAQAVAQLLAELREQEILDAQEVG